jgi:transcriptional regulator with XRE-family HTH domain
MGNRVMNARWNLGKSREEMAKLMGMTVGTYSNIEKGKRRSTVEEIARLAHLLSMDPETLVGEAPITTLEERLRNTPKSVLNKIQSPAVSIHGVDTPQIVGLPQENSYTIPVFGQLTETEVKELAGHLAIYRLRNHAV